MIPILIYLREGIENRRNYVGIVEMIAWSSAFLIPDPGYRAARAEVSRSDRPPGISAISPNRSRQRNTTLGLPRAHRVHRRHHLRRIHNFAQSLPNRLLALSLSSSLPFPVLLSRPLFSRIRCVTKLSQCPEASISMPNVATWLNVIRNSSTSLSDSPYIAAGNFGPGCRSILAGKETTKLLSRYLGRTAGSRWKKLRNGVMLVFEG